MAAGNKQATLVPVTLSEDSIQLRFQDLCEIEKQTGDEHGTCCDKINAKGTVAWGSECDESRNIIYQMPSLDAKNPLTAKVGDDIFKKVGVYATVKPNLLGGLHIDLSKSDACKTCRNTRKKSGGNFCKGKIPDFPWKKAVPTSNLYLSLSAPSNIHATQMLMNITGACVDKSNNGEDKSKEKTKLVRVWYQMGKATEDKGICASGSIANSSANTNNWKLYKTTDGATWLQCREETSGGCKVELPQTLSAKSIRLEIKCAAKCTEDDIEKQLCCPSTCSLPKLGCNKGFKCYWTWKSTLDKPTVRGKVLDGCDKCRTWGEDGAHSQDNTEAPTHIVRIKLKVLTPLVDFKWDDTFIKEMTNIRSKAGTSSVCAFMFKSETVLKYFDAWKTDSQGTIFSSPDFEEKPYPLDEGEINAVALKKVTDFDLYKLVKSMICLETVSKAPKSTECCVKKGMFWHNNSTEARTTFQLHKAEARLKMY